MKVKSTNLTKYIFGNVYGIFEENKANDIINKSLFGNFDKE